MSASIPLHSLVISIGPHDEARTHKLEAIFPRHEILTVRNVLHDVIGPQRAERRPDLQGMAVEELRRRVQHRLDLGERVVLQGDYRNRDEREAVARLGAEAGVPVFYLVWDRRDATRGDGLAEIIDMQSVTPEAVRRLDGDALANLRDRNYRGVTVIGDVHGSLQAFHAALRWARSRQHFVILTGDILSYGPGSLTVADEVHRLVCGGEAAFLQGNHERKITRWLTRTPGRDIRLSDGNRVTTQAIQGLNSAERRRWIGRFRGLIQQSEIVLPLANFRFAHAAVHPEVWCGADPRCSPAVHDAALFGEFDHGGARFALTYRWIEAIPAGHVAIVGHDIRSRSNPVVITNARGGRAVFLDTGSGKGGRLSTADIRFSENGMPKLENFNMH
jgi:hypothetical protein